MQDRETLTSTNTDLHISRSLQLEPFIPESRISSLSSGEFVGMVADNPNQPIELKAFCCRLVNDPAALLREEATYQDLPVIANPTPESLLENFHRIRTDIETLIESEMARIRATPTLSHLEL
jgi:hypothetical protein